MTLGYINSVIPVMSVFAMNSGHAEDWMFLRSDGDRETYIDIPTIERLDSFDVQISRARR
jgi:hypothetical protein